MTSPCLQDTPHHTGLWYCWTWLGPCKAPGATPAHVRVHAGIKHRSLHHARPTTHDAPGLIHHAPQPSTSTPTRAHAGIKHRSSSALLDVNTTFASGQTGSGCLSPGVGGSGGFRSNRRGSQTVGASQRGGQGGVVSRGKMQAGARRRLGGCGCLSPGMGGGGGFRGKWHGSQTWVHVSQRLWRKCAGTEWEGGPQQCSARNVCL